MQRFLNTSAVSPAPPLRRYGAAVVASALALLVSTGVGAAMGEPAPASLLVIAAILAAWYGGWGPGVLATALGAAIVAHQLARGDPGPGMSGPDALRLVAFAAVGLLASLLSESLHRALATARQGALEAEEMAARLREQAAALERQMERAHTLVTEAQEARARSEEAGRSLRLHQHVLESMREGVSVSDEQGIIVYTNPAEDRMFGYAPGELAGRHVTVQNAYPPEENERIVAEVIRQLEASGVWSGEWSNVRKDGTHFITHARITASEHEGRKFWVCVQEDITERRRAEARKAFLEAATVLLAGSLADEDTLARLAEHCLPLLADYASVDLRTEDGEVRRVAAAHRDPEKAGLLRELWSRYPYRAGEDAGVPRVLRTAQPLLLPEVPGEGMRAFARDAEHLALLQALAPHSYLAVPLVARGETYGVLSLVYSDSGRRYGQDELEVATELARRVAGAIDNARLFQQAASAAAGLRAQIEETERTHAALAEREAQFRTLADSIPQLAWMADASGSIFWYNRGWYAFTGTTPDEMEGWGWQSVHHPEHLPGVLERWRTSIATGQPFEMEFPLRGADGRFRWFLTRVLPLMDAEGRVARWFGTNTDVDELRAAREAAEEANRAKAQFLANMSHELRTPLNAIGGYADLLELGVHGAVTDAQRTDLQRIKRSAEHLLSLINDILNFAKIEAGQVGIDPREVPLRGFLADLEPLVAPLVHAKGLTYRYEPCDERVAAWADPEKVRQILLNLLSNAIKFTEPGGSVTLTCARRGDVVVAQVRDTGIGIPRDKLGTVFAPFVQVHRDLTVNHEGTGLGLAISRDLARMMGGDLAAESEEGRGSTFTLTVPARDPGAELAHGSPSG